MKYKKYHFAIKYENAITNLLNRLERSTVKVNFFCFPK